MHMQYRSLDAASQQLLSWFQSTLQSTYEVDVPEAVHEFVFTDQNIAEVLRRASSSHSAKEVVYLSSDGHSLDLSVFLTESLFDELKIDDPTDRLHPGNLASFCTVIEGISHFLCLVWNARRDRQISLLELELQAEIDKFVVCAARYFDQDGAVPDSLHVDLFERFSLASELGQAARERYETANQYAARYCRQLQTAFGGSPAHPALPNELRRFYRLSREEKLRRISRGH
jgi:hypothetical protein